MAVAVVASLLVGCSGGSKDAVPVTTTTTTTTVTPTTTVAPRMSEIAFASYRGGYSEVFVMNADGGAVRQFTDNNNDDTEPVWSPEGTKIALDRDRDGG